MVGVLDERQGRPPSERVAERCKLARLRERGYPFHDPFFTMLFLSADFLPAVRLSPRGVWDVKAGRVLLPARRRRA